MILMKTPKPVRATFSISFTNQKYMSMKINMTEDLFGKTHKKFLFGDNEEGEVNQGAQSYSYRNKHRKHQSVMLENDKILRNKDIASVYYEYKENLKKSIQDVHNSRIKETIKKSRIIQNQKHKYNELYLLKHDIFKENAKKREIEYYRLLKKYMQIYMWKYIIRLI